MLNSTDAIYIGLGSNLSGSFGSCVAVLQAACQALHKRPLRLRCVSPFYRTRPVGVVGQSDYVNAVAAIDTSLSPRGLLLHLHKIEADFGRVRRAKWAPRILDLDILDYRGQLSQSRPILPHPRLHLRDFVLRPLADIAPGWKYPAGLGIAQLSIAQLRQQFTKSDWQKCHRL